MADLTLINADVMDGLAQIESGSVQCVVTSPPYWGLRDYGAPGQIGLERTPEEYVARMVAVFAEVRRVLADDGTLWLNLGDSYSPDHAQKRKAGWKGEGPSGNSGLHAMVGGSRARDARGTVPGLKPKDLCGIPWRVAFALQADGWYLRSDIIWAKPNPMPESVTDRPTKAHEYVFLMAKAQRYYFDADAVKEAVSDPQRPPQTSYGTASASHCGNQVDQHLDRDRTWGAASGRNIRTIWTIATEPYPEAHFATFPTALPERCIRAGSRIGDTVLDPFAGSGTTLMVARGLGRNAVGIELNPDYCRLIEKRCALPWEQAHADDEQQIPLF